MTEKLKNTLTLSLFAALIFGFGLWNALKPNDKYSDSERRYLTGTPELTAEAVLSGSFMDDFEDYNLDQFPLRDLFRSVKAYTAVNILHTADNNGIYIKDGYVSKLDYPLNEYMLQNAADRFRYIYDTYLEGMNVYFSIVPDKNYFISDLPLDYEELAAFMVRNTEYMTYVDIFDLLDISDYYRTDTHWRQECIIPAAERLASAMGAELNTDFEEHTLDIPFYGVYCGQSALNLAPDTITYLTNGAIDGCTVTSYNTGSPEPSAVYDMEKAQSADAYELFLSGSDPLIVIDNPSAVSDKKLIIFRDSFASSLAPLLIGSYSQITLIDTRYIGSQYLGSLVDFDGQDVLFLYSTLLLNSSLSLK